MLFLLTASLAAASNAVSALEQAWHADPSNYAKGYNLALAYLESGANEKSRRVIDILLERHDQAELHNLLGDVEEAEHHVNEAARQYQIAAQMEPSEKNLFDLGSDLLNHRGFDPALKVFEFGVARYPQSARLRVGLGVAFYSLGQYDQAVETLCQAVDLDPEDVKPLDFLGKMFDISPAYAIEVRKRLAHFTKVYPHNSAASYYYALSLRHSDKVAAQTYFLRALQLKPDFAEAHYELGVLYEDEMHDRDAFQQFELALHYSPNLLKAHYHLARLYQKTGQTALAEQEFKAVKALKDHE